MTDVNIAVEILTDAFQNNFDTALIISADADLSPALIKINKYLPQKKLILAFPPERFSGELIKHANIHFTIGRNVFAKSQFPKEIIKDNGYILKCPELWK